MNKQITLNEILLFIKDMTSDIKGNVENITLSNIKDAKDVDENSLDWINPKKSNKQQIAEMSKAKVIICDYSIEYSEEIKNSSKVLIYFENPKLLLAQIANKFFVKQQNAGIHPSAIVHHEAKIDTSVFIGTNCSIGRCEIGQGTVIYPNVIIYDNIIIGNNVVIHAGSVIGTDGLGCERKSDGQLVKFPHFGGVIIEDEVELGAGTIIAKGALSNTEIKKGSKINANCYIAHNVVIEENVWISPKTNIAGSVKIGRNSTIFSSAIIREQLKIGNNSVIGMGSVITKDIPEGEIWFGNPAIKRS